MTTAAAYCVHCGQSLAAGTHPGCHNPRTALEPPRFCPQCARRMVVQVTPTGWAARCSRHGACTSEGTG
ncbi:hypothetical protein LWP59_30625 [Amycolatopsis acidiphila]|uniref:Biotin synthase auxiliary protein n=1 Tax=Amycolatopsis acidiphila TaxID=715473 RepID=A0A558A1V1_9PSEU|nr:hypothetical protein [Amycolatopsis acidiphila]TVT18226.1 hypothetical protein FNH06_28525 [Amycolatopsis acidiphila]UIJ58435.1 hypothetical protein LWP59_30625 [Amycolatopsis acidiphila]